jgi:hypothetical protein
MIGHKQFCYRWRLGVAFLGFAAFQANTAEVGPGTYSPAVYESTSTEVGRLDVFPFDGPEFSIPVAGWHGSVVYGFDGKVIYATTAERIVNPGEPGRAAVTQVPGFFRIDLDPMRVSRVPGSTEFSYILQFSLSQRQDKALVSGHRRSPGHDSCGLFEVALPSGSVRQVFEAAGCSSSLYGAISLSPDAEQAVTVRQSQLELLDLVKGTEKPLEGTGEKVWRASWSPNGKWIAALVGTADSGGMNDGGSKTILIDPSDPTHRREFQGKSDKEVVWSPDSRYLLHAVWSSKPKTSDCLTLEAMDVETGKRSVLGASQCKVSNASIGWVSSTLQPVGGPAQR